MQFVIGVTIVIVLAKHFIQISLLYVTHIACLEVDKYTDK